MIKIIRHPGTSCFIGNPAIIEAQVDSNKAVDIRVVIGDQSGELTLVPYIDIKRDIQLVHFDISDIARAIVGNPEIEIKEGQIISPLENFSFDCEIYMDNIVLEVKVYAGGIDGHIMNKLSDLSLNMFTYRLTNVKRQYLFTTRTNSHHIVLKETELYPFIFIHPGNNISFVSSSGKKIIQPAMTEGTSCVMDLQAVRRMFADIYNELPSFIVIQTNNEYSFDITLIPNQISEERYILRFKNSLGAYEQIEVTGKSSDVPKFGEEQLYEVLTDDDNFEEHRSRLTLRDKIEVETGYKSKDELLFIKDMIASDEIYLINGSDIRRCHVTVDQIKIPLKMTAPYSIPLDIRFVTDELYQTPELDFNYPSNYPLSNITRADDNHINGAGLVYGDDCFLY